MSQPKDRGRLAFISHVAEDAAAAAELCQHLEQAGVDCWIAPRDVGPGSDYAIEILGGIESCPCFVLLLSQRSNRSMYIRHELEYAAGRGKQLFPVRIEPVVLDRGLESLLSSAHWVEPWTPPHLDEWGALAEAIANVLADAASAAPGRRPAAAVPARRGLAPAVVGVALLALLALVAVIGWNMSGGDERSARDGLALAPPAATGQADPAGPPATAGQGLGTPAPTVGNAGGLDGVPAQPAAVADPLPIPPGLASCPRSFALIPGSAETFECACDSAATRDGLVWGTGFYTVESKLCRAAVHAGVIPAAGGPVTVERGERRDLFVGTERNGVSSSDERAASRSARFKGGAPVDASGPGPCPSNFAIVPDNLRRFSCLCDSRATSEGPVWGTDVYRDNSSMCRAAVHAGVIAPSGGLVTVERVEWRDFYIGTERNGVRSEDEGAALRSMRFEGSAAAAPGPGPCPEKFALIADRLSPFECVCDSQSTQQGTVWGSGVYRDISSLCRAALHAGVITGAGGPIVVERVDGTAASTGSESHGVVSVDARTPSRSMRFR